MKIRANILSVDEGQSLEWLQAASDPAPVYHTELGRVVGKAYAYEVKGEDVWATLDLEHDCPQASRAAAVVIATMVGHRIIAVFYTNLSRPELGQLWSEVMGEPSN